MNIKYIVLLVFLAGCSAQKSSYQKWIENQPKDWASIQSMEQLKDYDHYKRRKECERFYTVDCYLRGY